MFIPTMEQTALTLCTKQEANSQAALRWGRNCQRTVYVCGGTRVATGGGAVQYSTVQ